jgi:hypothetical protein
MGNSFANVVNSVVTAYVWLNNCMITSMGSRVEPLIAGDMLAINPRRQNRHP